MIDAATITDAIGRIWDRDHTLWQDDPSEVADRLGWLDCPTAMRSRLDSFDELAAGASVDGLTDVLLVGMGGSSLYPALLASAFPPAPERLRLSVLDSTHPHAVSRAREHLDPETTLLVAASKSGTTIETRSHLDTFWADLVAALGESRAGRHVMAITDPGSELADLGARRGFRAVVTNPADIGGRYSALSAFGLVPAALLGVDLDTHLDAAAVMAEQCRQADPHGNPGASLGAFLAHGAGAGNDQLTLWLPDELAGLGPWVEQLVAESTGKQGTGLLPIVDEPILPPDAYGGRRLFVAYGEPPPADDVVARDLPIRRLPDVAVEQLPAEVFRWEFATALAGALMGINPFDQPDVQAAKRAAVQALDESTELPPPSSPDELLAHVGPGDHVVLLAFVDPDGKVAERLRAVAADLQGRLQVPVITGIGPRYLHSTGQLHKGGPDRGVYAVLVEEVDHDVAIPGRPYSFGRLLRAQAAGDLAALQAAGRHAAHVSIDDLGRAATRSSTSR